MEVRLLKAVHVAMYWQSSFSASNSNYSLSQLEFNQLKAWQKCLNKINVLGFHGKQQIQTMYAQNLFMYPCTIVTFVEAH